MNSMYNKALGDAENKIWVAESGSDVPASGTLETPFATIDDALDAVTTTRNVICVLPGDYTLDAALDITVNGTIIQGIGGGVNITGAVDAVYMFKTVFGTSAGTKSVTFKNFKLKHNDDATQVGIALTNTGATAKIDVYIEDVEFDSDGGNSIDIDNVVAGQAICTYCKRCTTEGSVNIVTLNSGDRFRFSYGNLRGGLVTDAGDKDLEILIAWSTFLLNGITGGHANQRAIFVASVSETDADPNVYLEAVGADVETQSAQVVAFDAP